MTKRFCADFAIILLNSSLCTQQERQRVLEIAAESVKYWADEKCPEYDEFLFKEIVMQPNLLRKAALDTKEYFATRILMRLLR